jgi:hypothetical protein
MFHIYSTNILRSSEGRFMKRVSTTTKTFDRPAQGRIAKARERGSRVSSKVIPAQDPLDLNPKTTTVRLGEKLLQQIDLVAAEEGLYRNDVVVHFLKWALREHRNDQRSLLK